MLGKIGKETVVANIFGLFGPEYEGRIIPRNVRKYIPTGPVSQLRSLQSFLLVSHS
jgi:hypothetical protein